MMKKTMLSMLMTTTFVLSLSAPAAVAHQVSEHAELQQGPHDLLAVDNSVPPCDESATSGKPSCRNDSDSINVPPKMPHERGVIKPPNMPPEVPAEGLPNQSQPRQSPSPSADPRQPQTEDPASPRPGTELRN